MSDKVKCLDTYNKSQELNSKQIENMQKEMSIEKSGDHSQEIEFDYD